MAYLRQPEIDEEEKQAPLHGASSALGPAPVTAPAPANPNSQPAKGGKFVNFDRYLAANKDSAVNSANRVAGKVETAGDAAQKAMTAYSQQFRQSVDSAVPDHSKRDGSNGADPTREELAAWSQQQYSGPMAYDDKDAAKTRSQADEAARHANLAADGKTGLQTILQDQNQSANYGQGNSRFDAGLLQSVGGKRFEQAKNRYGKLGDAFTAQSVADANYANAKKQMVDENARTYGEQAATWVDPVAPVSPSTPSAPEKPPYEAPGPFQEGPAANFYISKGTYERMTPEEVAEMQRINETGTYQDRMDFSDRMNRKYGSSGEWDGREATKEEAASALNSAGFGLLAKAFGG